MLIVGGSVAGVLGVCWAWDSALNKDEAHDRPDTQRYKAERANADKEWQAAAVEKEKREALALALRREKYQAMTPAQRRSNIAQLCPIALESDCHEDELALVVQSVGATPEQDALRDLAEGLMYKRDVAEAEGSRGLLCCDGEQSPTCKCHGPHQGCCSHHRGICGCTPVSVEKRRLP